MTLSPAINAGEPNPTGGLPTLDFAGNPRTIGSAPDLGALEALIPFLQITPSSIDFGKVSNGGTANQEITLSNDGFASVQVTAIEINDSDQITVDESAGANPCGSVPFTLAANESCTVVVNWTPITSGTLSASIDWTTDDSFNPILSITISGNVPGSSGCSLTCSDIGKSTTPIIFAFILLSLITFRLSKFYFESIIAKQNLIKYKR